MKTSTFSLSLFILEILFCLANTTNNTDNTVTTPTATTVTMDSMTDDNPMTPSVNSLSTTGNEAIIELNRHTTVTLEETSNKRVTTPGKSNTDETNILWILTIVLPSIVGLIIIIILIVCIVACFARQRRVQYHLKKRKAGRHIMSREKVYTEEMFRESIHINELIFCDPSLLSDSPLNTPEIARISMNSPCYQPLFESDSVYSLCNGYANPASCTSSEDMLDPDRISVLSSVNSEQLDHKK